MPVQCDPAPGTPINVPMGVARGINPGRVTWVHDAESTSWSGDSKESFWWRAANVNYTRVEAMFNTSLLRLTGALTVADAWENLFLFHNLKRGVSRGYVQGEPVAIKVNLNGDLGSFDLNNANGLSPQYLKALLTSLTTTIGVDQKDIFVYDASRWFVGQYWDEPEGSRKDFPDVHFVNNPKAVEGGREGVVPDPKTNFVFSSTDVPGYNLTQLPTIVTGAKYMIYVNNLRGHDMAGMTETGKNNFGTTYRPIPGYVCGPAGYWCPMSMHAFANVSANPMGSYNVLVDLIGHPQLVGNAIVVLTDGLYGGPCEQPVDPVKFQSAPFNNDWSSSVFASQDPIAMDSVLFDILSGDDAIPYAHYKKMGCVDNYLHESALAHAPPSGVKYAPAGTQLESLGTHEHWNADKKYSRNLGTGDGIELVHVEV
jgi:hypothetical protein